MLVNLFTWRCWLGMLQLACVVVVLQQIDGIIICIASYYRLLPKSCDMCVEVCMLVCMSTSYSIIMLILTVNRRKCIVVSSVIGRDQVFQLGLISGYDRFSLLYTTYCGALYSGSSGLFRIELCNIIHLHRIPEMKKEECVGVVIP